jgi:hypothetical protein
MEWDQGFFFFFLFFFPNFSNVAEVVPVHPSDDLARLGYRLDMKVGKKKKKKTESFYILGYLMELIMKIWCSGKLFFEIWRIGSFFFFFFFPHQKSFVLV